MHAGYYEGIIQLRNPNSNVLDFIKKEVEKKGNVFIAKEEEVENGVDFYISSQRFCQNLGKKLQLHFGGELKISARLHTISRQTSKELYRVNVLFRLPNFRKGDIITYRGEKIMILAIGKKIFAKNINTGRKLSIKYSSLP